ncbi:hypothetical protein F5888DRAFT_1805159 [Russula emetica]|nr:hypothetical protein F5888DRAFT_1805159 [Russula emetica]
MTPFYQEKKKKGPLQQKFTWSVFIRMPIKRGSLLTCGKSEASLSLWARPVFTTKAMSSAGRSGATFPTSSKWGSASLSRSFSIFLVFVHGPGKRIEQWFLDARFLHFQPNIFEPNQTKLPSQFIIQNHWYDPSGTDRVDYIPEAMKSRGKWERYPESEIYDHENAGYWPPEDPTDISDLLTSVLPEGEVILDWGAAKTVLRESTVGLEVDLTENIPRSSIPSFGFSSTCIQYPLMTASQSSSIRPLPTPPPPPKGTPPIINTHDIKQYVQPLYARGWGLSPILPNGNGIAVLRKRFEFANAEALEGFLVEEKKQVRSHFVQLQLQA